MNRQMGSIWVNGFPAAKGAGVQIKLVKRISPIQTGTQPICVGTLKIAIVMSVLHSVSLKQTKRLHGYR